MVWSSRGKILRPCQCTALPLRTILRNPVLNPLLCLEAKGFSHTSLPSPSSQPLHRRQWLEFEETVAQHNRCAYAYRTLAREHCWRVFSCTERECLLLASEMLRSNPYRQRYLTCAESCWTFGECECDFPPVPCIECGNSMPRGQYGMWHPGDCECPCAMEPGTCPRLVTFAGA